MDILVLKSLHTMNTQKSCCYSLGIFVNQVCVSQSSTAFQFPYMTLAIVLMGVALVMKCFMNYCQRRERYAVLASVKGV